MSASAPVRVGDRVTGAEALPAQPRRPSRALGGWTLLLVGALLLPLSLAAVWARAELTDTERYVRTVAPLAANRAIQNAIVDDVTNGVMQHVRLDGLLKVIPRAERPAQRRRFTRGIREFVDRQVRQVVTGHSFPRVWNGVHRTAHQALDGILAASGNAPVTVDFTPVIARVKHQLSGNGLGIDIARRVPRRTRIVLLKSPDVPRVRTAYQAVRTGALLLPPAAALCLLSGLLLARRRRRALICTAAGCATAAALLAAALALLRTRTLDALPAVISRPAANAYADTLTDSLRTGVWLVVAGALLTATAAAAVPPMVRALRSVAWRQV